VQAAATRRPLHEMGKASISAPPAYSPEGGARPDRPGAGARVIHEV